MRFKQGSSNWLQELEADFDRPGDMNEPIYLGLSWII